MDPSVSAAIEEAFAAPVEGWDFSWLRLRAEETKPSWDFAAIVREASRTASRTLDIDTGGGEFLERVAPPRGSVVATEGYPPNVPVARRRLAQLGISVIHARSAPDNVDQRGTGPAQDGSALPFRDGAFDLVIDRHSSYWPAEVRRVLRPEGRFLTQQRGESGSEGEAWEALFGRPVDARPSFDLEFATRQLDAVGLEVTRAEQAETPMVFRDLAGVVFYLRIVPWAVESFDPDVDRDALEQIQRRLTRDGELRIRGSHMFLDALRR